MIDLDAIGRNERWPWCHGTIEFRPLPRVLDGLAPCFGPLAMIASLATTAIGAGVSAAGSLAAGDAAQASMDYQAKQLNQQAQTATAEGQRNMMEKQRQTGLVLSQLQARAAASGAGASDPGIQNLAGQIGGRGEYEALTDLASGKNRSADLSNQASSRIMQGQIDQQAAGYQAFGSLAQGAGSMFQTYGMRNNPYMGNLGWPSGGGPMPLSGYTG